MDGSEKKRRAQAKFENKNLGTESKEVRLTGYNVYDIKNSVNSCQ
jgi:hypothetical protein